MTLRVFNAVWMLGAWCVASAWGQTASVQKVTNVPRLTALTMLVGGRVLREHVDNLKAFGGDEYVSQWPGVYFRAAFKGTEIYFRVGASHELLRVEIDGRAVDGALAVGQDAAVYRVSALPDAAHTVSVMVVSESQASPNRFGGFGIPAGVKALVPKLRTKQIEFIGDSHTVGYGNTSPKRQCTPEENWAMTDNSKAFGPLVAEHYDADYQENAISGHGVVRNYNGFAGDPVPVAYPYALFDKKQRYADAAWRPRVIVISLGTNDFTTPLNAGEKWKTREELHSDYEATYVRFLVMLRARNPQATIILWATEMANGEIESEVRKVMERAQDKGLNKLVYVPIDHLSFSGCDFHPSAADDMTIRDRLIEAIDRSPGVWDGRH